MGIAEDKFYEYLRGNYDLIRNVRIIELLDDLAPTFTQATNERLRRVLDREGNEGCVWEFVTELKRRDDWVNRLLEALWRREYKELFYKFRTQYQSYRPNIIFREPDPFPHSLPPSVNHYEAAQPDSPPRYQSLPSEGFPRSPGVQPGSSALPALNQVQPRPETIGDHQALEISESVALPRYSSPPEDNAVSLDAAPFRVLPPASVEEGASGDGISKTPIPESQSFHSVPPMDYTRDSHKVPDSPERSAASTPPAGPAEERVQEQPMTPGASKPLAQSTPAAGAYSPGKGAIPKKPVPAHNEGTPICPKEEHTTVREPQRRSPGPTVQPMVANSPHQHPSQENASSAGDSGPRDQRREQPANIANPNPSSCRPLNDDHMESYVMSKPGVLSSVYTTSDVSNANDEPPPMTRVPVLEISETEDSNTRRSQVPDSSQPSGTRSSQRSPPPQEISPPRFPEAPSMRSSSRRSPGEDDEVGAYGAVHGRLRNDDHLREPEENSYEVSFTDFSDTFGVQYRENPPPPELTGGNDAPPQASPNDRKSRPTHNTAKPEVEKTSKSTPLEDPVVIALSIAVVCLSLYIVWLKYKN